MPPLPFGDLATIDIRKLEDYCLNPQHPRGRHKARVFLQALGIQRRDSEWLRQCLLDAARTQEAVEHEADSYGQRWRVDVALSRQGKSAMVRSLWIVSAGGGAPRFVTCWVL